MRLLAFQGLRYAGRAGDADRLAAPPYDQIDDAARDRFHAASPYQFVHLTRPAGEPDPYRHAAELHGGWLREGIIARDERPALYPYVVELAGALAGNSAGALAGNRRLGVMGLVPYAPPSEIRPHEQTLDKPLADRLALLEAMRVDLEPALLLAEDEGRLDALLAADLDGGRRAPLVRYHDADGHQHLLYRIEDPARIAAYQEAVAGRPAAIADGHHRYKVGQRFAAEHHAAAGTAAGGKLAVVTSMSSRALTIDPIHRALRQPIQPIGTALLAGFRRAVQPFPTPSDRAAGAELARAVAAAPQPALGVWVVGQAPEVWLLSPTSPGAPLVVKIFQQALLPALGMSAAAATDGTLVYRSNPDELFAQVARGELGTGFWLPPMRPADFAAAIAQGELLPPKSTRFLPKAMSGLVWSDHQSRVLESARAVA
jgi:uncharacterized protein (DUF1015 family)